MQGLDRYKQIKRDPKKPVLLWACVDEIKALSPEKFNYPLWCKKVKQSGRSFSQIYEIVKKAKELPDKYNKIGYIFNQLK